MAAVAATPIEYAISHKLRLKALCIALYKKAPTIITDRVYVRTGKDVTYTDVYRTLIVMPSGHKYVSTDCLGTIDDTENVLAEAVMRLDLTLAFDKENAYYWDDDGFVRRQRKMNAKQKK